MEPPRAYLLVSVISLALLAQVAVASAAAVSGDEADERMLSEMNHEDLQDPDNTVEEDHRLQNSLRSSILLQILRAESALQQAEPHSDDFDEQDNNLNNKEDIDDDGGDNDDNVVAKRVFCNGFTGCGGRHRRRRIFGKRLIPVLVKRPFCNSLGCFKAQPTSTARSTKGVPRARLLPRGLARGLGSGGGREKEGDNRRKRLFCNGYGGCRGGKRSLFSPWLVKMNSVADSLR